jgi:chromodomain-helicase-DNA-binding protein 1
VLDFFGVPVKALEVLSRIKELTLLAKSVRRFNDPPSQYRLKSHPKNPQWHKTCGWTQVSVCGVIGLVRISSSSPIEQGL